MDNNFKLLKICFIAIFAFIALNIINDKAYKWSLINKWDGKLPNNITSEKASFLMDLK